MKATRIILAVALLLGSGVAFAGNGESPKRNHRADIAGPIYPFDLAVQQGKVDGVELLDKFGFNGDVGADPEDVWLQGGTYTFISDSTSATLFVSATDDTTCEQVLTIVGEDADGAAQTATVQLNGTTATQVYAAYTGSTSATAVLWTWVDSVTPDTTISTPTYVFTTTTVTAGVPMDADKIAVYDTTGTVNDYLYNSLWSVKIYVSSTSATATQDLTLEGLDDSFDWISTDVTLDGTTQTAVDGKWSNVHRMYNIGTSDIAGTVYAYTTCTVTAGVPQTATAIKASFLSVEGSYSNQTLQATYMVPDDTTLYLTSWYVSAAKADDGECSLRVREYGKTFRAHDHQQIYQNGEKFEVRIKCPAKSQV